MSDLPAVEVGDAEVCVDTSVLSPYGPTGNVRITVGAECCEVGHAVLTPTQARELAAVLVTMADEMDDDA